MDSAISGFHEKSVDERLRILKEFASLSEDEIASLKKENALGMKTADMMIENVVGTIQIPLGIATNFLINGKDYLVPMALEEPSVVAAASYAAKLARPEGFTTSSDPPLMIGQCQLVNIDDCEKAKKTVLKNMDKLIEIANQRDSVLVSFGGGAKDVEARIIKTKRGSMLIVHLIVDVRDAMGANAVNTMIEAIAPMLAEMTGGRVRLKIISNLATKRLVRAKAVWKEEVIDADVIDGILDAYEFAENDRYRCATHNKGIMNGIDAVAIATGQDFRALEAGAHAYAALDGYRSLTKYEKDRDGNLVGIIELPLAVGLIGGAIKTNPIAKIAAKILGVKSANELAEIMACVGLANNFAAMRAMVVEGIQKGHMKLHAKNIAIAAGAEGEFIHKIAEKIIEEKNISVNRAKELLEDL
ncbi:MAG: hydroxymethylglutaryl-CoA reductase, degradative [Candidatus Aenigmatarchaeota archaeon]